MLTKAQVIAGFKASFPVAKQTDHHAHKVAFDSYIDSLRKSGQITEKAYDSLRYPYEHKRSSSSEWKVNVTNHPLAYYGNSEKAARSAFAEAKRATTSQHSSVYGEIATLSCDGVVVKASRGGEHLVGKRTRKRNSAQGDIAMWAREVPRGSIIRGVRVGALVRPVYASGKEIYRVPPNAIIAAGYRYDQKREAMSVKGDFHDFVKRLSALLHGSDKALTTPDFAPYL